MVSYDAMSQHVQLTMFSFLFIELTPPILIPTFIAIILMLKYSSFANVWWILDFASGRNDGRSLWRIPQF